MQRELDEPRLPRPTSAGRGTFDFDRLRRPPRTAVRRYAGNAAEDRWVTGRSTSFATGMEKAIAAKDENARRAMQSALNRATVKRETYARGVQVLMPKAIKEPEPETATP